MRIKPAPQSLKDFENQCENLESNVISSMLFYYMVDEEADVKTRVVSCNSPNLLTSFLESFLCGRGSGEKI